MPVHTCPQMSISVHSCPYLPIAVYTCLRLPIHIHTCPHLTTHVHPFYLVIQHSFLTAKLKSPKYFLRHISLTTIRQTPHVSSLSLMYYVPNISSSPLIRSPYSENNTNCEAYRHTFPLAHVAFSLVDQNFQRPYLI